MPPLDSAEPYFGKPGEIIICNLSGSRTIPQTQSQPQYQNQQSYSQRAPSQYSSQGYRTYGQDQVEKSSYGMASQQASYGSRSGSGSYQAGSGRSVASQQWR